VYVGQTGNLERRLNQHFNGEGSEWTKKYRPEDVIEVSKSYNSQAEAKEAER
jgi:predicted GIY-YIG superfamily endonuclease